MITVLKDVLAPPAAADPVLLPSSHRRILLAGFMGAGKSTIGRLLADRLRWRFLDLDTYLESRTGSTIPQLFELHGESEFRRLESAALASALAGSHTVLALGGGAPEGLTNRLLIEQNPATTVVFLDAPFPILYDRCLRQALEPGATSRPVLADQARAHARYESRRPLYQRLARLTLDTDALTPEGSASQLLHLLTR